MDLSLSDSSKNVKRSYCSTRTSYDSDRIALVDCKRETINFSTSKSVQFPSKNCLHAVVF